MSSLAVGDILVRWYYRGKLSHGNHNRQVFTASDYCGMHMRNGPHARGTTMASCTRSEVLVSCGIAVVKKRNTTSTVWDYFGLRSNVERAFLRKEATPRTC